MTRSGVPTSIALLRGVNVGRGNRIAMADLREGMSALGYVDVRTLLASGTVLFRAPGVPPSESAARIVELLLSRFGISTSVAVLTEPELDDIISGNPWRDEVKDPSRLLVSVPLVAADSRKLQPLLGLDWNPAMLAISERVAYVWCPDGVLASELPDAVSRALNGAVTTRNWATMLKLHALTSAAS